MKKEDYMDMIDDDGNLIFTEEEAELIARHSSEHERISSQISRLENELEALSKETGIAVSMCENQYISGRPKKIWNNVQREVICEDFGTPEYTDQWVNSYM